MDSYGGIILMQPSFRIHSSLKLLPTIPCLNFLPDLRRTFHRYLSSHPPLGPFQSISREYNPSLAASPGHNAPSPDNPQTVWWSSEPSSPPACSLQTPFHSFSLSFTLSHSSSHLFSLFLLLRVCSPKQTSLFIMSTKLTPTCHRHRGITLSFDVSLNVDDNFQRRFIMALPLGSELAVVTFEYEAR